MREPRDKKIETRTKNQDLKRLILVTSTAGEVYKPENSNIDFTWN